MGKGACVREAESCKRANVCYGPNCVHGKWEEGERVRGMGDGGEQKGHKSGSGGGRGGVKGGMAWGGTRHGTTAQVIWNPWQTQRGKAAAGIVHKRHRERHQGPCGNPGAANAGNCVGWGLGVQRGCANIVCSTVTNVVCVMLQVCRAPVWGR